MLINALDRSLLARLAYLIEEATAAFEKYEYARALQICESFFWSFTDDFVELIKDRAYGARGEQEQASVLPRWQPPWMPCCACSHPSCRS